ncbi:MAG: recombination mediator RecR [Eubacteriales bacterium]|nr:recombination mediator RecR [Eubacteriales bacterium]
MAKYAPAVAKLIAALGKLPGIGNKTAQRLCFYILSRPDEEAFALAEAIREAKTKVQLCKSCCNLSDVDPCPICSDPKRDHSLLCVLEQPADVAAIERSQDYNGLYHVLHGAISPMNHVSAEDIKLRELLERLQQHPEITEVILANNSTVEGEATAMFIARLLQSTGIRVSRIAQGLPSGSSLEFADEMTLARALAGRQVIQEDSSFNF